MRKFLLAGVAAAAVCAASAPASAATIVSNLGTLNVGDVIGFGSSVTSGNDYDFAFNVASGLFLLSQMQASTIKFTPPTLTTTPQLISYSLFSGTPGSGSLIGSSSGTFAATLGASLGAGNYFLHVDNIAASGELVSGGISAITAVPEPATWAMMICGFFGVGAFMRRQRRLTPATVAA